MGTRFPYSSDSPDIRGYIDKDNILETYDEEDIFSLVFGYRPKLYTYVTSPFRQDGTPNCWFNICPSGKLRFVDFANTNTLYGVKMHNMDCFDAVRVFYRIPNFYMALRFIAKNLSHKGTLPDRRRKQDPSVRERRKVELSFTGRNFIPTDRDYWLPYGIHSDHLMEDNVFPVSRILMRNTRNGDVDKLLKETCYALTGFGERIKFYFPYRHGNDRFISTCTQDDVGHVDALPPYMDQLIITKAYKDRRVVLNTGRWSVWNQNEGMEPHDEHLFPLVKRARRVIVLYDNDRQGIASSIKLSDRINSEFPRKARPLWLPEHLLDQGIKDPSDLRKEKGESELEGFLKYNMV